MEKTTIELTEDEARLFIEFQKYYQFILMLEKVGAMEIRSGTLTINFDVVGNVGSFEVHKHYRLSTPPIPTLLTIVP